MDAGQVYRAFVRLYPRRFREEYGDDLVALFEDQCRDESPGRVYARTALDLIVTVPVRHLEVPMRDRAPGTLVLIYLTIAVAGLATAVVGGTNEVAVSVGLLVAALAGTLAVITARRHSAAPADATGRWWKITATGLALITAVIIGAGLGIEAWYLAWLSAITGVAMVAVGLLLGAVRLILRLRPTAAG